MKSKKAYLGSQKNQSGLFSPFMFHLLEPLGSLAPKMLIVVNFIPDKGQEGVPILYISQLQALPKWTPSNKI